MPTRRPWLRFARVSGLAAGLAMFWCALVLLAHVAGGWLACESDTSDCATTTAKTFVYQGQLRYPSTPFDLTGPGAYLVGGFRTDSQGRYCIVWTPDGAGFLLAGNPNDMIGGTGAGQRLHGQPPAGCQYGNGGVLWDRSRDLTSSPQYLSVVILDLATIGLLAVGIARGKRHPGAEIRAIGLALTAASTALPLILWWSQL